MKTLYSVYHKIRRTAANMPPLPTELFTFPLGLTLVQLCPPAVAWIAVAAVLLSSILLLWIAGALWSNRSVVGRSLFVLLLWGGLFLAVPGELTEMPLGSQAWADPACRAATLRADLSHIVSGWSDFPSPLRTALPCRASEPVTPCFDLHHPLHLGSVRLRVDSPHLGATSPGARRMDPCAQR